MNWRPTRKCGLRAAASPKQEKEPNITLVRGVNLGVRRLPFRSLALFLKLLVFPLDDLDATLCLAGFGVQVAYISLFLLWAIYLAIRSRNLPTAFNESNSILIALLAMLLVGVVLVPLDFVGECQCSDESQLQLNAFAVHSSIGPQRNCSAARKLRLLAASQTQLFCCRRRVLANRSWPLCC